MNKSELIDAISKGAHEMAFEDNAGSFVYAYELTNKIIELSVGVKDNEYFCEKVNVYDNDLNDLSCKFENVRGLIEKECVPCRKRIIEEIKDEHKTETERIFGSESAYINYRYN